MKTFNRLLTYFKYEPLKYAIGIVLSFVSAMTAIYAPLVGKEMIDYVSNQMAAQSPVEMSFLFQKFGWFMLVTLFSSLCGYGSFLLLSYASNGVSKKLRDEAFAHMQRLPISYFDDKPAGKISAI